MEIIDKIPNKDLEFYITDQLWLETLLMEIRGKTISYSSHKKKVANEKEKELLKSIDDLELDISNSDLEVLEQTSGTPLGV